MRRASSGDRLRQRRERDRRGADGQLRRRTEREIEVEQVAGFWASDEAPSVSVSREPAEGTSPGSTGRCGSSSRPRWSAGRRRDDDLLAARRASREDRTMRVQPAFASALTVTTGAPNTSSASAGAGDARCRCPTSRRPSGLRAYRASGGWQRTAQASAPALGGDGDRQCVVEPWCPSRAGSGRTTRRPPRASRSSRLPGTSTVRDRAVAEPEPLRAGESAVGLERLAHAEREVAAPLHHEDRGRDTLKAWSVVRGAANASTGAMRLGYAASRVAMSPGRSRAGGSAPTKPADPGLGKSLRDERAAEVRPRLDDLDRRPRHARDERRPDAPPPSEMPQRRSVRRRRRAARRARRRASRTSRSRSARRSRSGRPRRRGRVRRTVSTA